MKLFKSDISKFQSLYFKYFGVNIGTDEARKGLSLLVNQMETIYRPITRSQLIKLDEYDYEQQGSERSSKKDQ